MYLVSVDAKDRSKVLNQYQNTPKNANITLYIKKNKKTLCNTLNRGNWNSGFVKLCVCWAERDRYYFHVPSFFLCIFLKELEMLPKLSQNQPLNVHPSSLVNMLLLFRKQSSLVTPRTSWYVTSIIGLTCCSFCTFPTCNHILIALSIEPGTAGLGLNFAAEGRFKAGEAASILGTTSAVMVVAKD